MRDRGVYLASEEPRALGVVVAIGVHVAIIAALLVGVGSSPAAGAAGIIEGRGDAPEPVSGMPATSRRFVHTFRLIDAWSGSPVEAAEVRDVLADTAAFSGADGRATLRARPAARLIVRVSRDGYDTVTFDVRNIAPDTVPHVVTLEPAGQLDSAASAALEREYARQDSAISRRDAARFLATLAPGYTVLLRDGSRLTRPGVDSAIVRDMRATRAVRLAATEIVQVTRRADTLIAGVVHRADRVLVDARGRAHRVENGVRHEERWVPSRDGWRIVLLRELGQMYLRRDGVDLSHGSVP